MSGMAISALKCRSSPEQSSATKTLGQPTRAVAKSGLGAIPFETFKSYRCAEKDEICPVRWAYFNYCCIARFDYSSPLQKQLRVHLVIFLGCVRMRAGEQAFKCLTTGANPAKYANVADDIALAKVVQLECRNT